jgi:Fe-S cluster assembly scaffold protein SufB
MFVIIMDILDVKDLAVNVEGHLECRGLLMDDASFMESIPELIARRKGVEITHEAAVGKISEKEITYVMTRKLSRDQAVTDHSRLHGLGHTGTSRFLERGDKKDN